ncbi:MAG: LytTR family DNA-binding domain-containing protein, partial [Sediminibacterium sp.]|nr:LytTR family DNA-binding domain-containing protein [Sediminibacterium sp.]
TLKSISDKLPSRDFLRVHRSFIVPIHKIEKFSKSKVWISGKEVPIGSSYNNVYDQLLSVSKLG